MLREKCLSRSSWGDAPHCGTQEETDWRRDQWLPPDRYHFHSWLHVLGNPQPTSSTPVSKIPSLLLDFKAPCPSLAPPFQSNLMPCSSREALSAQVRSAFSLTSTPSSFPPFCLRSSCSLWQDAFLISPPLFKSHQQVTTHISSSPKFYISLCPRWSLSFLTSCCP